MKKTVTIYQLAEECGVSVATISRVLNGSPKVAEKTRVRIQAAIDKYHFSPNSIAQAMSSSRTNTIGVIMPDITYPFFSTLFLEIERYAAESGYSVLLTNTLHGGSARGITSSFDGEYYFQLLRSKCVDGVIIVGGEVDYDTVSPSYVSALNTLHEAVPVVVIGEPIPGAQCAFVNRNLAGGIQALVNYLANLGHREIGYLGGQQTLLQTAAQLQTYRASLEALGLPVREENVALKGFYAKDGYEIIMSLLASGLPLPEAFLAANDQVALGAIRALADAHLRVPTDISIASCDMFPGSEYAIPPLTTIDQQHDHLGQLAVRKLLAAIKGDPAPNSPAHSPRLVVRESCGERNPQ